MRRFLLPALTAAVLALAAPAAAQASNARVAALQVALRAHGLYAGTIDGIPGPATAAGIRAFQRRAGVGVDGIVGPRTRRALGPLGHHALGSRPLVPGRVGWDVAALQFLLESHGFPCGHVDGGFGARTQAAVLKAQLHYGLPQIGVAGPATLRALSGPPARAPYRMRRPVAAGIGEGYGPRGTGWHPGLDFPAPTGTPVVAAASGTVVEAGWNDGFGLTVVLAHGFGVRTRYAHLSSIAARLGRWIPAGYLVGRVGATGFATGPHLHFEITVRAANVNPLGAL